MYWTWNREYNTWSQQALSMKNAVHTYIHTYMNVKVHERAVHRQAHTHTLMHSSQITLLNSSSVTKLLQDTWGTQRHRVLPQFGGQHSTGTGGQFSRAEEKHLIIKEQVKNVQFSYCASREHYKPLLLNSSGATGLLIQAKRQTRADYTALGAALHTEWRTILKGRGEAFHLKEYATTTIQSYRRFGYRASWYIKCSNTLMPMP